MQTLLASPPPQTPRALVRRPPVAPDERAARRSLRRQIARLEAQLAALVAGENPLTLTPSPARPLGQPHLLSLGELERARDHLDGRVRAARSVATEAARGHAHARRRLEAMLLDPGAHRFARVTREDLGERGCGGWEVRPRLGLIGMLAGWWHVVVSSGCPLAMAYHHRRQRSWGRNAGLELVLTALVLIVVVGVLALFLFVYHDLPFRIS